MPAVKENTRQSNIELLRILAMVLIVAHHFSQHSGFQFPVNELSLNRFWVQLLLIGGRLGANIFVLISGYFMITADRIKTEKALKLWLQMFFYAALIFVLFTVTGIRQFRFWDMMKHVAPVTFRQWWFASAYFILYLISPFINCFLRSLGQKRYLRFLVVLFLLWCVIPTVTDQKVESNELLWFMFLYAIAGYYRLYGFLRDRTGKSVLAAGCAVFLLTYASVVVFDVLGTRIDVFGRRATYFYDLRQLPTFLSSVLLFVGFSKIDIKYSRWINTVSSATFGVYLIHDSIYARPFLWKTLFRTADYAESRMLIPYSLFVIAAIFAGCSVIETLRIRTVENWYMPAVKKIAGRIEKKWVPWMESNVLEKLEKM